MKTKTTKTAAPVTVNDATLPEGQPVPAAPKKRGRSSLPDADKAKMQAARIVASEDKARLLPILQGEAITNVELWANLPPTQFEKIVTAQENAKIATAQEALQELRDQYEASCKDAGETPATMETEEKQTGISKVKYTDAEKADLAALADATDDEAMKALLTPRITDHRLWQDLPPAQFDKLAGIAQAQKVSMASKLVVERKAKYEAAMKAAGLTLKVAPVAPAVAPIVEG